LGNGGLPTGVGSLVLGVNVIRGSVTGPADTEDRWIADLGSGLSVTAAEIEVTNLSFGGIANVWDPVVPEGTGAQTVRLQAFFLSNGTFPLTPILGSLPLVGPSLIVKGYIAPNVSDESFEYEMRVTVSSSTAPVPEPGTLALSGLAVAGVLAERRRRRRRA